MDDVEIIYSGDYIFSNCNAHNVGTEWSQYTFLEKFSYQAGTKVKPFGEVLCSEGSYVSAHDVGNCVMLCTWDLKNLSHV